MPSTRTGSYRWPGHCHGGYYAYNRDGSRSCVNQIGINSSNLPIYTVYNVISGILSHVTQTGYNSYGQPTYSSTDQFGSPISG